MNLSLSFRKPALITFLLVTSIVSEAQFLMDMIDTTKEMGKGLLSLYGRFDRLRLGGYIQPQFQVAQEKGAHNFEGGDFAPRANSRFMLRRSRIRVDYVRANGDEKLAMQFVFQFDATERGVFVRDVWARLFENKFQKFSFTTGVFARPFGYELNTASSDRESPERGRMSQTLMKVERDLGAMLSFEPRKNEDPLRYIKLDAGIFNGQGLNAPGEYDSYKDFISRLALKPYPITPNLFISAGLSLLEGGISQNSKYTYSTELVGGKQVNVVDSAPSNIGRKAPRKYRGADIQLRWNHGWGNTEIRAEYWWGTQTGSASSSETPPALLAANEGYYIRKFNGAFFYFLQNLFSPRHQVGIKFDWYDPNSRVKGAEIVAAGSNLQPSDIRFNTLQLGYNHYLNENLKFMLWYAIIRNEKTGLPGYLNDQKDNIFTCRMQYRF